MPCTLDLATNQENTLIATLPTSKDHIPTNVEKIHGCIDLPEINFENIYSVEEYRL